MKLDVWRMAFAAIITVRMSGDTAMPKKASDSKPVLKPLEGNKDLFVFEKLERNPPAKRESLHSILDEASRSAEPHRESRDSK